MVMVPKSIRIKGNTYLAYFSLSYKRRHEHSMKLKK